MSTARRSVIALSTALVAAVPAAAIPTDFEVYADLRLVQAKGESTWFTDWMGKGRYGGDALGGKQTDLYLSEVSLIAKADITWDLQAFAHIKYDPEQDKPADLVEAFFTYAPVPKSAFSYQVKAGLFFPHISRENVSIAWTSPYTITPSAVNSWVGEEIRALGLEARGTYKKDLHRVDLTAAIFGFNDPAGTLLAYRGWGIGDAKVGAFSQLPLPHIPSIGPGSDFLPEQPFWVHPIRELDNRPGFYGALDYSYDQRFKAGAFYYDNRADPEVLKSKQYGWRTRFWNFYFEGDIGKGTKFITQFMRGSTQMGMRYGAENRRRVDVDYDAAFVLVSQTIGEARLSARYDWFGVDDNSFVYEDNNNEDGDAFTFAASYRLGKKTSLIAEYLHINSTRPARETIGFAPDQSNDIFQLSFRQRF